MKKGGHDNILIVSLYVNDIVLQDITLTCTTTSKVNENEFEMTNLGDMTYFLGV